MVWKGRLDGETCQMGSSPTRLPEEWVEEESPIEWGLAVVRSVIARSLAMKGQISVKIPWEICSAAEAANILVDARESGSKNLTFPSFASLPGEKIFRCDRKFSTSAHYYASPS